MVAIEIDYSAQLQLLAGLCAEHAIPGYDATRALPASFWIRRRSEGGTTALAGAED
jgi:hypothetical protein